MRRHEHRGPASCDQSDEAGLLTLVQDWDPPAHLTRGAQGQQRLAVSRTESVEQSPVIAEQAHLAPPRLRAERTWQAYRRSAEHVCHRGTHPPAVATAAPKPARVHTHRMG